MGKNPPGRANPAVVEPGRVIGRHKTLLSDPVVLQWWEARSLRSRLSADQYLRQLGLLLERTALTPAKVLALAKKDPDRLRDLLIQDAAKLKRAGRLDSYISKFFEGLKSLFRFHRVAFDGFPVLSPIKGASLSKERIPRPEELGRVLDHLSLRGRVLALFMAHAGVRPGVLGSYQGENGLRLSDLPDLKFEKGKPSFTDVPFTIRVPASLSKTRVSYVTFGSPQLATAFLAYLEDRGGGGEALTPESPVVASNITRGVALRSQQNARYSKGFLTTKVVVEEVRSALQSSVPEGVRWRPYVLRAYCSTRLLLAEGQGRISRDLREAILGHDGGSSSRYHVGKRWGEELLVEARREYANASEFLETNTQGRTNVAAEFRRTLLGVAGLSPEEAVAHMEDSNEDILALLRTRLLGGEGGTPKSGNGNGHAAQKPVSLAEAESLLSEGWTFV
ncbi:MAG: hypothetical protein HKL79_02375, partial [Thermoplasmata archaeon]|nr:hypothetical protein [Thermoplasmata archaeon]